MNVALNLPGSISHGISYCILRNCVNHYIIQVKSEVQAITVTIPRQENLNFSPKILIGTPTSILIFNENYLCVAYMYY